MTTAQQAYMKYKSTSVQTASPERLLVMLYDGLIRSIETAKVAITLNQPQESHRQLTKSQDIVWELRTTLKMEYEISHALAALYDYFQSRLVDANVRKSIEPLDEILPRIQELREAWVQASIQLRSMASGEE
jgi:flagellar secretion chaperone FliS